MLDVLAGGRRRHRLHSEAEEVQFSGGLAIRHNIIKRGRLNAGFDLQHGVKKAGKHDGRRFQEDPDVNAKD